MKKDEQKESISRPEGKEPFIMHFSSQEEAESYQLKKDMSRSDMEKFKLYCRMMRIGKMLSSAKILK